MEKVKESELHVKCITEHEGFGPVSVNVWVLQPAYFTYRQHYSSDNKPTHE